MAASGEVTFLRVVTTPFLLMENWDTRTNLSLPCRVRLMARLWRYLCYPFQSALSSHVLRNSAKSLLKGCHELYLRSRTLTLYTKLYIVLHRCRVLTRLEAPWAGKFHAFRLLGAVHQDPSSIHHVASSPRSPNKKTYQRIRAKVDSPQAI